MDLDLMGVGTFRVSSPGRVQPSPLEEAEDIVGSVYQMARAAGDATGEEP